MLLSRMWILSCVLFWNGWNATLTAEGVVCWVERLTKARPQPGEAGP